MDPTQAPIDPELLTEIFRRAQEIDGQTVLLNQPHPELEQYIKAAEEVGISRDATMQALRERLNYPLEAYEEGQLVFAKSADEHFYVARIQKVEAGKARVRFLNGSDASVAIQDLRMFATTPGQKVNYYSASYYMWVDGQVIRFNPDGLTLTIAVWGSEETVPLDKVRMVRQRTPMKVTDQAKLWLIGAMSAIGGGAVGAALMWLLSR